MKKLDEPCARCGFKWPTFHICLDLSDPATHKIHPVRSTIQKNRRTGPHTAESRARMSEAQRVRHDKRKANLKPRNDEIIRRYSEELIGAKELASIYELGYTTILGILHEAAERGEVVMRTPGETIRHERLGDRDSEIVRRYAEEKLTIKALSEEYNLGYDGIRRIIKTAAKSGLIEMRDDRIDKTAERDVEIVKLYSQKNYTIPALSAKYSLADWSVRRIINRAVMAGEITKRDDRLRSN